jgi:hypothetical protein
MRYKAFNKKAIDAVMRHRDKLLGAEPAKTFTPEKKAAWWDITKWPQWWETGAKELEKTAPGRIITAPIRLPEAVISASKKTVEQIPGIVGNVGKVIPIIAVGAVLIGGGILWSKFSKGKKVTMSGSRNKKRSFYLAPTSWNSSGWRDVYDDDDIANLPDDWNAGIGDCDYIGEFTTHRAAYNEAKKDHNWVADMRKNFDSGI